MGGRAALSMLTIREMEPSRMLSTFWALRGRGVLLWPQ